ncbi:MAG TPA: FkbM family methyltransferase [Flavobacteriales bacterium]|nr:FkbM family methyltransferase [Flavobacteriales bacterium]
MITDILYVTYAKDAQWFRWSVQVLIRNMKGYRHIIAVAPEQDRPVFDAMLWQFPQVRMVYIADWPGAGYMWQQWVKMHADTFTDAELICHIDSDVFIKEPTHIADYLTDGKPTWLWAYYTDITDAIVWKAATEHALGMRCDQEFMQAFPFILHRVTYVGLRAYLIGQRHTDAEAYLRNCHAVGRKFSEFNALGRYAFEKEQRHYHFIDRNRDAAGVVTTAHWPKGIYNTRQFWSHAPVADHLPEIQGMLTGSHDPHIRCTNRGIWVIEGDTHISKWVEDQCRLDFDRVFMDKVCSYISPGDVVVDVGAYIGDHTEAYAKATRGVDGGRVLAFEPNALPYQCLIRNMIGHGHVQCINQGLGEFPAMMGIALDPNVGASHLVPGEGIPIVTLDSFDLERCALIKVDAEGMELGILRGAAQTISRCRPVMVLEINIGALERQGATADEIYTWLRDRGYRIDGIENGPQFDIFCHPQ